MSAWRGKLFWYGLMILCLGGLIFLLTGAASGQQKTAKDKEPAETSAPSSGETPAMVPPPAPVPVPEKAAEEGLRGRQEKGLELKKSSDKIGGHEVPHRKGPKDQ